MKKLVIVALVSLILANVIPKCINESTGIDILDDMVLYVKGQKGVVGGAVLYSVLVAALSEYLYTKHFMGLN
jgi:hypothetical protein